MSILDFSKMKDKPLILQYIIDCRNQGHLLPYEDYQFIDQWLKKSPSTDHLLLILSEVLPRYYEKATSAGKRPGSLRGVHRTILKKLRDTSLRVTVKNHNPL